MLTPRLPARCALLLLPAAGPRPGYLSPACPLRVTEGMLESQVRGERILALQPLTWIESHLGWFSHLK